MVATVPAMMDGGHGGGDGQWWSVGDGGCRGGGGWLISNILASVSFLPHVILPILMEREKVFFVPC